ncbi:MAG: phosphoribosylglycinamide formyltransferase [Thermoleophilia bacterium]|nr:phosphoribosylglycinamide formyltransferase [Thermoleophilia bacterium]
MAFRLAVLASGTGSNLQVLIDRLHGRVAGIEVAVVISNVPGALALERAERADIPTAVFPLEDYPDREARDLAMAEAIDLARADLVVLAGYMQLLTPGFLRRFPYRVINLHPALLPSFPGDDAIKEAVDYGVKVSGVTVHFVDEGVDTGPVIRQEALPVHDGDDVVSLATKIHALEHQVLPRVIELFAKERVVPPAPGFRRVKVDDHEPSDIDW